MSTPSYLIGKPHITEAAALALLRERFATQIEDLSRVPGGETAQIYAFTTEGERFIFRLSPPWASSVKERVIQRLLASTPASSSVPIPPIVHVGQFGDLQYTISRFMPGTPLTGLLPAEYEGTIPALLETLDAIHTVDVRATTGYGVFDDEGKGFLSSWRASLIMIGMEAPEPDDTALAAGIEEAVGERLTSSGDSVFATTFLERDVWDTVYARMMMLLDFCPEDRYLVHGDYGFDNVLAADGRITAVLDWNNAQYGDFLYDVAWLDFWPSPFSFRDLCMAHYAERGVIVPDIAERILCYQCAIALNVLRFFALRQNAEAYLFARTAILSRLG